MGKGKDCENVEFEDGLLICRIKEGICRYDDPDCATGDCPKEED